jgi:hypothetical protein
LRENKTQSAKIDVDCPEWRLMWYEDRIAGESLIKQARG